MELDITNSSLFTSLLEINFEDCIYDIHNDFDLKSIRYCNVKSLLEFNFDEAKGNITIDLSFKDVDLLSFKIPVDQEDITIDNLHRGRYEYLNKLYDEYNGKRCFYIEFYSLGDFNILCREAKFIVRNKN